MDDERLRLAREVIGDVDREMASLFERRMDAARDIAAYKRERGLPVLDAAQERAVIGRNLACIDRDELRGLYARFLTQLMDISKTYQRRLMDGMRVACGGAGGTPAHTAARRIFPDAEAVSCADCRAAYEAVERGGCDVCVLPVEDGGAGEAGRVIDLMFDGSLHVTGVYALPVRHDPPGGTMRFAVFSRAENGLVPARAAGFMLLFTVNDEAGALAQAMGVIGRHGFSARVLRSRPMEDLPGRCCFLAEIEGDDRGEAGRAMLDALAAHCHSLKIAGRFGPEIRLEEAEEA